MATLMIQCANPSSGRSIKDVLVALASLGFSTWITRCICMGTVPLDALNDPPRLFLTRHFINLRYPPLATIDMNWEK